MLDAAPYHAWSNVEFVALDDTLYEIGLVVLGSGGFHLVELKAWSGGESDWLEHPPGRGRRCRQQRDPRCTWRWQPGSGRWRHGAGTALNFVTIRPSQLVSGIVLKGHGGQAITQATKYEAAVKVEVARLSADRPCTGPCACVSRSSGLLLDRLVGQGIEALGLLDSQEFDSDTQVTASRLP